MVIVGCPYAGAVNGLSLQLHLLAIAALLVNLWLGGDLVEGWAGHVARSAFELLLILAYGVLVLGVGVPLRFWRRSDPSEDRRE
jgi:hypothetical protein